MSPLDDDARISSDAKEGRSAQIYFAYKASLRIYGVIPNVDELSLRLGVAPTRTHRRGGIPAVGSAPYEHDMWIYTPPVHEMELLHLHIDELWRLFRGKKEYLLHLKKNLNVDVFLGYRTNCDHCGLAIQPQSLEMFIELDVPFGLSIIVI